MMLTDKQQAALYFARKRHRIANSLTVSASPAATATVGVAYAGFTVAASGGRAPYSYGIWGGQLPPGITLDASTGEVAGTPTTAGSYSATLSATDAYGTVQTLPTFTITVS